MLGAQSVHSVVRTRKVVRVMEIISVFPTLLGVPVSLDLWGKIARQVRLFKLGRKYERELKQTQQVVLVKESDFCVPDPFGCSFIGFMGYTDKILYSLGKNIRPNRGQIS